MSEWVLEPRIPGFSFIVLFKKPRNALKWSSLERAKLTIKQVKTGQCVNKLDVTSDGYESERVDVMNLSVSTSRLVARPQD